MNNHTKTTTAGGNRAPTQHVVLASRVPDKNQVDARPFIDPHHPLNGKHPLEEYLGEGAREGVEWWRELFRKGLQSVFH